MSCAYCTAVKMSRRSSGATKAKGALFESIAGKARYRKATCVPACTGCVIPQVQRGQAGSSWRGSGSLEAEPARLCDFPCLDSRWRPREICAVTARRPRMKIRQECTDPATQQRWRVTDAGTRTSPAVCLSAAHVEADPSWLEGPPHAVAEEVWDE
jgi:hypothetical protein